MKVIGLTGGIATGKSTASRTLKSLGATVWDADQTARDVVRPGQPGFAALKKEFGDDIFGPDGQLDRRVLAQRVFGKPQEVLRLNHTLHPIILMDLVEKLKLWRAQGVKVVIVDAPLLFESGADVGCDEIWVLSCGEDEQLRRVIERDGLSEAEAVARLEAQMSDAQRRAKATRIIDTSGSEADTQRAITAYYEELLEDLEEAHEK
jgi:dephospho-CoA kinase